jgi:DNA-binding response OmpR family regulator
MLLMKPAPKHIVIIEDDALQLVHLQHTLEEEGFRVTPLTQLNSIEELIGLQPDFFIINEDLPVINGHILCIILKSKAQTRHIPVILMSDSGQLETIASLCEAEHFLTKPFESSHLLEIVHQLHIS